MRKGLLGSLLILMAGAGLAPAQAPAQVPAAPEPKASAAGAADVKMVAPVEPLATDAHPWNPPVGHANVWPYQEALQAGVPDCGPPGDFWLVPEYLLWTIKGQRPPPLVTSGTAALDGPDLGGEGFSGGRFTAGTWLNDEHCWGFEAGYFFLGQRTDRVEASSAGGPGSAVLARPFTDVRTGLPASFVVAGPGVGAGAVRTSAESSLQGARADLVYELYCCQPYRVELFGGFRYQDLAEELSVGAAGTVPPGGALLAGRQVAVTDESHTRNVFFGGELGARAEYRWAHLVARLSTSLALGSDQETIHVAGATIEATRGRPVALPGGLLALPSNSGRFHDGEFSAIPQLGLQVGYEFNPYVRAFVGYDFLYWSEVARPGDQIDLGVNPAQVPALRRPGRLTGPARPAFAAQQTDFWAQGLTVGAEFRY
jgi:hypothetical protein